ncbi:MAG: hypothetical protein IKW11_02065 [Bacteroidales bacterium]|nr:hypothetical protein [Bacteroidales bacterium]
MKRLLISLIAVMFASALWAQNQHLTFKGVPIDGTLNDYVVKMSAAGFTHLQTEDGIATLKGDFAGYKDCRIYVQTLKPKNLVSEIVVEFPARTEWFEIESDYKKLKGMLTTKYGNPKEVREEFQGNPSDGVKLSRIGDYEGFYYSIFELPNGKLTLIIKEGSWGLGYVDLWYSDKINSAKVEADALNDL